MAPNEDLARVIVVGGGYSGVAVSKLLDQAFEVILIEKNEVFFPD
ncbi:MAG: hypothetical protein QNJ46_32940 [Leptolyngbyaceae cyanobacterium MO_188.B28]|nr:hypothetical protein [Leptolyngbyaceae cyanobacterium MO_188.B28]